MLPLKVMLDSLRFYAKEADKLLAKLLTEGAPALERGVGAPGDTGKAAEPHPDIIEALKTVVGIRKRMEEVAAMAAPYCHPRQGNAIDEPAGETEVPLAERLKAYQRRDEIEAAGDKVIELKPQSDQGACPRSSEPLP